MERLIRWTSLDWIRSRAEKASWSKRVSLRSWRIRLPSPQRIPCWNTRRSPEIPFLNRLQTFVEPNIDEMLRDYLWRQRTKFEATIAFSMLEPWEKMLSVVIFTFFALLLVTGLYRYLPEHVSIMRQRAAYYLWGQDGDDLLLRHLVDPSTLKQL